MNESIPAVSIVMPVRNAGQTLVECLESIAAQTMRSWELIAIDDGSTDDSTAILRSRAGQDPRIRVVTPGRIGLVAALNRGIAEARVSLVARMDADDIMLPRRLERQVDYLRRHPEIALVGARVCLFPPEIVREGYREYIRWQNGCVEPDAIAAGIYVESPLAHPSVMMRKEIVEDLDGYADGPFPEDYELWLRMHHAGCRMAKVPEVMVLWREREDRASRIDPRYSREAFDRLRARYLIDDPRLRADREIVIWGAGRATRQRARHVMDRGLNPAAWIDVDPKKIGNTVWGRPVRGMDWLPNRSPKPFVLIYVARHGARDEVAAWLNGMGYRPSEDYLAVG